MRSYKYAAAVLVAIAALGFTGCNGRDQGHDHDRVVEHTTVERTVVEPTVVEHPVEQRDPHRDDRPCDHVRDPHCDDRPR